VKCLDFRIYHSCTDGQYEKNRLTGVHSAENLNLGSNFLIYHKRLLAC